MFGSTADGPVRIDLWGDEVDRLTAFSVSDQRSTDDLDVVEVFPCRELLPTDEVRERASALVATEPWGREQWERLAEGQIFDGMESWLPWLVEDHRTIVDLLPEQALVVVVEPRRLRDRAGDILAEEIDLATSLARTWDVGDDRTFPRLHAEFGELFAHHDVPVWTMTVTPDGPDVATVAAMGWNPVVGDGEGLVRQLRTLLDEGYRVVVAAEGEGSAVRLAQLLREHGLELARGGRRPGPGRPSSPPPRWRCWPKGTSPDAGAPTGRPAPASATTAGLLRRPQARGPRGAPPARRGSLRRHGQAGHRRRGA